MADSRHEMTEAEWQARFERLIQNFRAGVPPDATPEEIEADITLAREEVRNSARSRTTQRGQQPDDEWRERFNARTERVQSRIPPDVTPEEIEADIAAVIAKVRMLRRISGSPETP